MKNNSHLRAILRTSGYKATGPRLAILSLFEASRKPLSAQEVIALIPKQLNRPKQIDQATVYRTLGSLKKKGIIIPIDLRHNHAHYELAHNADHHHIVCLRCGRIEDVEHRSVETMEAVILEGAKHFSEIQQHTLEFYGVCKACAKLNDAHIVTPHKHAPL